TSQPDLSACGDGVIESGEQCDGTNLGGATCNSLGFSEGALACTGSCTYDTSNCSTCGDGNVNGLEVCDGSNLNGATCVSLGHAPGALACAKDCNSYDTSGCTGGYIAANTSFSGLVCSDGLRYGQPGSGILAVCTEDNGVWRGTLNSGTTPVSDP